jgi:hypothetical protein
MQSYRDRCDRADTAPRNDRGSQEQGGNSKARGPCKTIVRDARKSYTHFSEQFQRETVERLASKLMFCAQPSDLYSVAMPAKAV